MNDQVRLCFTLSLHSISHSTIIIITHSTIIITFQMFLINRKISKYNLYDTFFKDEESLRDRTEGSSRDSSHKVLPTKYVCFSNKTSLVILTRYKKERQDEN